MRLTQDYYKNKNFFLLFHKISETFSLPCQEGTRLYSLQQSHRRKIGWLNWNLSTIVVWTCQFGLQKAENSVFWKEKLKIELAFTSSAVFFWFLLKAQMIQLEEIVKSSC